MADLRHSGKRSWWSGKVKTDCGLTLDRPARSWRKPNCKACRQAREGRDA